MRRPAWIRNAPALLLAMIGGIAARPAVAELSLLMVEQMGCVYCERWDREIAPAYPLTDEGAAAPLRRIDLRDPVPEDVSLERRAAFTPTFVLLDDGVEVGRIEGYPGEDFFWPLLAALIEGAGTE